MDKPVARKTPRELRGLQVQYVRGFSNAPEARRRVDRNRAPEPVSEQDAKLTSPKQQAIVKERIRPAAPDHSVQQLSGDVERLKRALSLEEKRLVELRKSLDEANRHMDANVSGAQSGVVMHWLKKGAQWWTNKGDDAAPRAAEDPIAIALDVRKQEEVVFRARRDLDAKAQHLDVLAGTFSYRGRWLNAHLAWQLAASAHMGDDAVNKCVFRMSPLSDFTPLDSEGKGSVSATIVGFARIPAVAQDLEPVLMEDRQAFDRVAIKISFPNREAGGYAVPDNSLDFEREVIYESFRDMLVRGHCPNVVAPIASFHCAKGLDVGKSQALYNKIMKDLSKLEDVDVSGGAFALVIERGTGKLEDLLDSLLVVTEDDQELLSEDDFFAILFQVQWTLACFYRLGIRHNDLHLGNVLYRRLRAAEDLFYELADGRVVHLRTRYIVKIYDMDRGSIYYPHVERNLLLDQQMCGSYGECGGAFSLFDPAGFTMVLCSKLQEVSRKQREGLKQSKKKNEDAINVGHLLDFVLDHVFDRDTFASEDAQNEGQHWIHWAQVTASKKPAKRGVKDNAILAAQQMLERVRLPEDNLATLVNRRKVQIIAADAPELRDYAMGNPYTLPPLWKAEAGHPKRAQLGLEAYDDVQALQMNGDARAQTSLLHSTTVDTLEHLKPKSLRSGSEDTKHRWSEWHKVFGMWSAELAGNRVPQNWEDVALRLVQAVDRQVKQRRLNGPGDAVQTNAVLIASLLLVCPMYYGLKPDVRASLREAFASVVGSKRNTEMEAPSADQIAQAEKWIWTLFDNDTLPVTIPLLYNMK